MSTIILDVGNCTDKTPHRLQLAARLPRNIGPKLPDIIRLEVNPTTFKTILKKFLVEGVFYFLCEL